jgi:Xaa-Pro aminopeptidase
MSDSTFDLAAIQAALKQFQLDGWLLYDFRNSNALARRVLGINPAAHTTRRLAYFIPAAGTPKKLVHRIEEGNLDALPGARITYLRWQEFEAGVKSLVDTGGPPVSSSRRQRDTGEPPVSTKRIAMEYSPRNGNPYVSRVDAGTVELVQSFGVEVVSSGDLVQLFEASWSDAQWQMHQEASKLVCDAFEQAWKFIADRVTADGSVRETAVQAMLMKFFAASKLVTDHPPIVGVGPHSGQPHYAPQAGSDGEIGRGGFVLIDVWAKLDRPQAVYADYTQVGFVGREVPKKYAKIFNIVAAARDAGIARVKQAFAKKEPLQGWQVDDATRAVIDEAGYGQYFCHRTGHNIGQETHGNGANMDNLETHDERRVLPRTCFSIEPGIYMDEFGVRSEVNVFIDAEQRVHVTGALQPEIRNIA